MMMQLKQGARFGLPSLLLGLCMGAQVSAQDDFRLRVGMSGTGANTWPSAEAPEFAIDGFGQKYLNFGRENTGFIVMPSLGSSVVDSMTLWTANDAEERDPASYRLFGTNTDIDMFSKPGTEFPLADFTEISMGDLTLPSTRNTGGMTELLAENSVTVDIENTDPYSTFLVLFPTVKNPASANSMQIAEVSLNSSNAPVLTPGDAILGVQLFEPIGDPVGPQPAPTAGNWSVREWRPLAQVNNTSGADEVIADPQWQFESFVTDGMAQTINLADPQAAGGGQSIAIAKQPFFSNTPAADDDIVVRAVSRVIIPEDGDYTFGIDGDDGARLTLSGANFTYQGGNVGGMAAGEVLEFPNNTGDALSLASTTLAAGEYDLELVWQERGGGAFVEVFAAPGVYNADQGTTVADLSAAGFSPVGLREEVVIVQGTLPTTAAEWTVRNVDVVDTRPLNNLADAQAAIDLDNMDPDVSFVADTTAQVINFNDPDTNAAGGGRFLEDEPFPVEAPGTDDNDLATLATATINIAEENDYIFGFASDDGASLTLEGADFTILGTAGGLGTVTDDGQTMAYDVNTGNSDTFGWTHLTPGEYELSFLTWERGGGAFAELFTGVGNTLESFLASARLLGSPEEMFNVVYSPGLQLGGEGGGEGIPGDFNGNGTVEQADLDLVLLNWGQPGVPEGWANDLPEGNIDQAELDGVLLNWGNTAGVGGAAGVPEPSTFALVLVVAGLGLGLVRRKR